MVKLSVDHHMRQIVDVVSVNGIIRVAVAAVHVHVVHRAKVKAKATQEMAQRLVVKVVAKDHHRVVIGRGAGAAAMVAAITIVDHIVDRQAIKIRMVVVVMVVCNVVVDHHNVVTIVETIVGDVVVAAAVVADGHILKTARASRAIKMVAKIMDHVVDNNNVHVIVDVDHHVHVADTINKMSLEMLR